MSEMITDRNQERPLAASIRQPRLLPATIDTIATEDPGRVLAEFLEAPHVNGRTFELTFSVFARLIDRLAWWLRGKCAKLELRPFDTIAFAGFLDLRHYGMLNATIKCGYKVEHTHPCLPLHNSITFWGPYNALHDMVSNIALDQSPRCCFVQWSKIRSP